MGANQSSIQAPDEAALAESIDSTLQGFLIDGALIPGSGRFSRTHRIKHKTAGSTAVMKSLWIDETTKVESYREELERIKEALKGQPHVAPFTAWFVGDARRPQLYRPIFLLRPHLYTTLSDRFASRPWLDTTEKVWIVSQLLDALDHMHKASVVHGFIATENVGLTANGWVVLLDVASHKSRQPLPDDDPSAYMYYFHPLESNKVREKRCYLAPERFYTPSSDSPVPFPFNPTPSSDIFSTGCVLVELFLNGERCMELGDIMEYRKLGAMTPNLLQKLNKIESSHIRATCRNMLHLNPEDRLDAVSYHERLLGTEQWPESLGLLTTVAKRLTTSCFTPDAKIAVLAANYREVLWETMGVHDVKGGAYIITVLGSTAMTLESPTSVIDESIPKSQASKCTEVDLFKETEALLAQLEDMTFEDDDTAETKESAITTDTGDNHLAEDRSSVTKSSLLIYLQMVLSSVRFVQHPSTKLVSLHLIGRLSNYTTDGARLQRILPAVVSLLNDSESLVRALAVRTLADNLERVHSFPPSDSKIFQEYIFKRVAHMISDPSLNVRIVFAEALVSLAETAHRFLDISHAVRLYEAVGSGNDTSEDDNDTTAVFDDRVAKLLDKQKPDSSEKFKAAGGRVLINSTYDSDLGSLQEIVSRWVVHITTDQSEFASFPKRALLQNLERLCAFFGLDGVMAFILPQILAFLNDRKDWELRATLFRHLPSLCGTIGRAATEEFVLPCVEIGLVDSQERVIAEALSCMRKLTEMGLLSRTALLGSTPSNKSDQSSLVRRYSPLLLHPSASIRCEAMRTNAAIARAVTKTDTNVYILPTLLPFLRYQPTVEQMASASGLQACLQEPWKRSVFDNELRAAHQMHSNKDVWTSVDGESRSRQENVGVKEGDSGRRIFSDYVRMLWRQNLQSQAGRVRSNHDPINGIEGSAKLAQSVMFPRQSPAGIKDKSLPEWFSSLREKLESVSPGQHSESSAIRSVSQIGEVYGLSIMGPPQAPADGETNKDSGPVLPTERTAAEVLEMDESVIVEASQNGEWGAGALLDPTYVDTSMLVTKLRGIGVPPLPPKLGHPVPSSTAIKPTKEQRSVTKKEWRPKISALVASSTDIDGHSALVSRLAVSPDNSFFVSAGYDGKCKVWETSKAEESVGVLRSSYTYSGHSHRVPARINDVAMVEGSHSIISGDSNGCVHVWRVDAANAARIPSSGGSGGSTGGDYTGVIGLSPVRQAETKEGEILAVSHFGSPAASTLVYATQKGRVHSWDLRSASEPFVLRHAPSLGLLSSMSLGHDRNYIVTGTSRGYIGLWDVRFNRAVKLWRHCHASQVTRLATSYVPPPSAWNKVTNGTEFKPFLFVACGPNETGMFDMSDGTCRQRFRCSSHVRQDSEWSQNLPPLWDVPFSRGRGGILTSVRKDQSDDSPLLHHTVNSIVGSIGASSQSFLITGGSDSRIRFWDFSDPSKCFCVGGSGASYRARATFERRDFDNGDSRILLCREVPPQKLQNESTQAYQGLKRPDEHHSDSISDVKLIHGNLMLTCSRDSTVKVWR